MNRGVLTKLHTGIPNTPSHSPFPETILKTIGAGQMVCFIKDIIKGRVTVIGSGSVCSVVD